VPVEPGGPANAPGNEEKDRAGMAASDTTIIPAPEHARPPEEEQLLSAARRALSMPKSRVALLLRLSLLQPPLPRPHHRRIARAILEDVAHHNQGETFELGCGDMVLLCRAPSHSGSDPALHPATLPHAFARLFRSDVPPPGNAALAMLWTLERDGAALLAYATRRLAAD